MIIDISNKLKNVIALQGNWNRQKFTEIVILILRRNIKSWVQWDDDSGELWARILLNEKVLAVISLVHPLAFVSQSLNEKLLCQLEDDIVVIKFHEYDGLEFSVNDEMYYKLFGVHWRAEICDIVRFSVHDLYFQYNT